MTNSSKPSSAFTGEPSGPGMHRQWLGISPQHGDPGWSSKSTASEDGPLTKTNWPERIAKLAVMALVLGYLGSEINDYFTQPEIHFSYATGTCVRVVSNVTSHTCSNPPEKFEAVWVE